MPTNLLSPLVRCAQTGRGPYPPLFFVHGFAGNVERFENLVRQLGREETIYVLENQREDGAEPLMTRVEDMAKRYLREVRSIQPSGPYFLIGYSFSGLIAFEMAQQLHRQGEQAALVGLIDAGQPVFRKDFGKIFSSPRMMLGYVRRFGELLSDPEGRSSFLFRVRAELWRCFFGKLLPSGVAATKQPEAKSEVSLLVYAATVDAAVHYHPQPYAGRLDIFRVEERISVDKFDRYLGWKGLADAIEVHDVPGDHVSVGEEPHVRVLGEKLRLAIQTARSSHP